MTAIQDIGTIAGKRVLLPHNVLCTTNRRGNVLGARAPSIMTYECSLPDQMIHNPNCLRPSGISIPDMEQWETETTIPIPQDAIRIQDQEL